MKDITRKEIPAIVISSLSNYDFLDASGSQLMLHNLYYGLLMSDKITLLTDEIQLDLNHLKPVNLDIIDNLKSRSILTVRTRKSVIPEMFVPASTIISPDVWKDDPEITEELRYRKNGVVIANDKRPFCEDLPAYYAVDETEYKSDTTLVEEAMDILYGDDELDDEVYRLSSMLEIEPEKLASILLGDIMGSLHLNANLLCPTEQMGGLYLKMTGSKDKLSKVSPVNQLFEIESIIIPEELSLKDFESLATDRNIEFFRELVNVVRDRDDKNAIVRDLLEKYQSFYHSQKQAGRKYKEEIITGAITSPLALLNPLAGLAASIPLGVLARRILDKIDREKSGEGSLLFLHKMKQEYPRK